MSCVVFSHFNSLLGSFLEFVGKMVSLKELTMHIWFRDSISGGADLLAQVLRHVRSSHFKICDILLKTTYWEGKYWHSRHDMLNAISGEAMQQCLQNLHSIPEFTIHLEENDAAFGKNWWSTEITKGLPALKDTLAVHVEMHGLLNFKIH